MWTATSPSGVDVPVQTVGDNVLRGRLMNPTEPGLYEIRFESKQDAFTNDDTDYFAVSQVLIPSAGADVTSFLYNELNYVLDDYHDHDASNVLLSTYDPVPADTSPGWTAHWTDFITQGGTAGYPRNYDNPDTTEPSVFGAPVIAEDDLVGSAALQGANNLFYYNGIAWGQASAPASDWDMSTVTPDDIDKDMVPTLSSSWVYDFSTPSGTDYNVPSYVTVDGHVLHMDEFSWIVAGFFSRALENPILDGTNTEAFLTRSPSRGLRVRSVEAYAFAQLRPYAFAQLRPTRSLS